MSLKVGDVIAGKYRIEGVIGEGGMGVVMAGRHLELDQLVAIKFVHPSHAHDPELVQRFFREARAAAAIRSDHVVRVLDVSRLENGTPYMVMEHLAGTNLEELLRERGPMQPDEAVDFLLQACEAIAEAHAAGLVHRDLKPANLFLADLPDGSREIKVLDFGISKVLDSQIALTQGVMGTLLYMPPEQLRSSRDVDIRADIWALGVILYELLWGPLVEGDPATAAMVMKEQPPPLRQRRPDLNPLFDEVVQKCMQRDVDQRFGDVKTLVAALEPCAPGAVRELLQRIGRLRVARVSGAPVARASGEFRPVDLASAPTEPVAGGAPEMQASSNPAATEQPSPGTVGPWTPREAPAQRGTGYRWVVVAAGLGLAFVATVAVLSQDRTDHVSDTAIQTAAAPPSPGAGPAVATQEVTLPATPLAPSVTPHDGPVVAPAAVPASPSASARSVPAARPAPAGRVAPSPKTEEARSPSPPASPPPAQKKRNPLDVTLE